MQFPALLYASLLFGGKLHLFTEIEEQYKVQYTAAEGACSGGNIVYGHMSLIALLVKIICR